ncbi:major facilitator superfamily MFS_1 [Calothrix sp. NIES-4071]|nr:major facilitator superfamily MFS_1 [Calothrix sp. NIES-4071]BAZ58296.1 major facilitator superfamily MFS_1 [Calothrix sp. NIES-4105]
MKVFGKQERLQKRTVLIMAVTSGAAVANLYYNQPLLAVIQEKFQVSSHAVGFIPTLTQIGYALGILLIVPLGDLLERRRLIISMFLVTAVALAAFSISPNITWLQITSLIIGITTVAAQLIIPLAAQLAEPHERGKVVGTIMSGLFIGVLLARTVSGFIAANLNWRAVYWLASVLMLGSALILSKSLPKSRSSLQITYSQLIGSLFGLIKQPILLQAALSGAMSFGAFNVFWSTLVFLLAQPPYHYGSEVAGLFGLVGVAGAIAAPMVGKLTDRSRHERVVGIGLLITTTSFILFWIFGHQIIGLIIGVILLDLGVQTTQVSNQARIYSLPTELHSRLNAVYISSYFLGGALGSYLGAYTWSIWNWQGVCIAALMMLAIGFTTFYQKKSINN